MAVNLGTIYAPVDLQLATFNRQFQDVQKKIQQLGGLKARIAPELEMRKAAEGLQGLTRLVRTEADNQARYLHQSGQKSAAEYQQHLQKRLGDFKQYSSGWMKIAGEMQRVERLQIVDAERLATERKRLLDNQARYENTVGQNRLGAHRRHLDEQIKAEEKYSQRWMQLARERQTLDEKARTARGQIASGVGNAAGAVGLAAGAASLDIARTGAGFDLPSRFAATNIDLSEPQIKSLKSRILGLTDDRYVQARPSELAEGFFQITGTKRFAKVDGESLDMLRVGARAGVAGRTSVETALQPILSVMSAGLAGAETPLTAANTLFQGVKVGKFEFKDLANMGDVFSMMKMTGATLPEGMASIAMGTSQGLPAAEMGTALKQMLSHIQKPDAGARAVFDRLGVRYGATAIQGAGGLSSYLTDMFGRAEAFGRQYQGKEVRFGRGEPIRITSGEDVLASAMPEIRGLVGINMLRGGRKTSLYEDFARPAKEANFADYMASMREAQQGKGALQRSLDIMGVGPTAEWNKLIQQFDRIKIALSGGILPGLERFAGSVEKIAGLFNRLPEGVKADIGGGLLGVAAGGLALGGIVKVGQALGGLFGLFKNANLAGAIGGVGSAIKKFVLGLLSLPVPARAGALGAAPAGAARVGLALGGALASPAVGAVAGGAALLAGGALATSYLADAEYRRIQGGMSTLGGQIKAARTNEDTLSRELRESFGYDTYTGAVLSPEKYGRDPKYRDAAIGEWRQAWKEREALEKHQASLARQAEARKKRVEAERTAAKKTARAARASLETPQTFHFAPEPESRSALAARRRTERQTNASQDKEFAATHTRYETALHQIQRTYEQRLQAGVSKLQAGKERDAAIAALDKKFEELIDKEIHRRLKALQDSNQRFTRSLLSGLRRATDAQLSQEKGRAGAIQGYEQMKREMGPLWNLEAYMGMRRQFTDAAGEYTGPTDAEYAGGVKREARENLGDIGEATALIGDTSPWSKMQKDLQKKEDSEYAEITRRVREGAAENEERRRVQEVTEELRKLQGVAGAVRGTLSGVFEGLLTTGRFSFRTLAEEFKGMLIRMVAQAAATKITDALFGYGSRRGQGPGKTDQAGDVGRGGLLQGVLQGVGLLRRKQPRPSSPSPSHPFEGMQKVKSWADFGATLGGKGIRQGDDWTTKLGAAGNLVPILATLGLGGGAGVLSRVLGVGGLLGGGGGLLSGIRKVFRFDDPVNDRAAVRWGADFARFFAQGAAQGAPAGRAASAGAGAKATPGTGGQRQVNITHIGNVHNVADVQAMHADWGWHISRQWPVVTPGV